jgi:hypothetical protein
MTNECTIPPSGWYCTRGAGHDGPCAAVPGTSPADKTHQWLDRATKEDETARAIQAGKGELLAIERASIDALLAVAYAAWNLADNSAFDGDIHHVEQAEFDSLSEALDLLAALPDDQPGYTMGEAAKAAWALRRLIGEDQ